ncbi:pilus assembly PilX family protein [Halopseudomonas sp.]|uniref:pilus assembly PilX family protein n=1 Tax=Halopseudomonas sp. TaxID=2901191 RepID=UPI00300354C5
MESVCNQRGAALMVSLVFLLLLSLAALAGVRSATSQERMVANLHQRTLSFQAAEAGVRWVERQLRQHAMHLPASRCGHAPCGEGSVSAQEAEAFAASWQSLPAAARESLGLQAGDIQLWYRLERIGSSAIPVRVEVSSPSTLYRVSVLSQSGNSRTVVEATYAHTRL